MMEFQGAIADFSVALYPRALPVPSRGPPHMAMPQGGAVSFFLIRFSASSVLLREVATSQGSCILFVVGFSASSGLLWGLKFRIIVDRVLLMFDTLGNFLRLSWGLRAS